MSRPNWRKPPKKDWRRIIREKPPGRRSRSAPRNEPDARRIHDAFRARDFKTKPLICLALAGLTFLAFWQVLSFDFVSYDDPLYVTQNPVVMAGLTWNGIAWAFSSNHATNWHPVTWLSHMLDVQLFGLDPGWHHLTSLLFHIANTLLLFLVLNRMTTTLWRSAFVAALFALHPLHVESVAWIAERKDVSSACFFLLTLWTYAGFARSRTRNSRFEPGSYFLALLFFALGLMSKPMLVTTPFVLLLLDHWPLGRFETRGPTSKVVRNLLLEKIPFLALALISCVLTIWAQEKSIMPLEKFPLRSRVENAIVSYLHYIEDAIWPTDLAVFYPYPEARPTWIVFGGALALLGITAFTVLNARRKPHLATGWFWFLGTLVPVIGLVQVGQQSSADRYMYLPLIGLAIIFVWSVHDFTQSWPRRRTTLVVISASVLGISMVATSQQLRFWRNSQLLFERAIAVTSRNGLAHYNLGIAFLEQGRMNDARAQFLEAEKFRPRDPEVHNNLANILVFDGKLEEAAIHYSAAIQYKPDNSVAHYNLGLLLAGLGRAAEAIPHYRAALESTPDFSVVHRDLGLALAETGEFQEALEDLNQFLKKTPADPDGHASLGKVLAEAGDSERAREQLAIALRLQPDLPKHYRQMGRAAVEQGTPIYAVRPLSLAALLRPGDWQAHGELGRALSQLGRLREAREHYESIVELRPGDAQAHYDLARALVMEGNGPGAISNYRRVLALSPDHPAALNELAWILATHPRAEIRNGSDAVQLARRACELTQSQEPRFLGTLDVALAEAGQFEEAIETAEKTRAIALARQETEIANAADERIRSYRANQSSRQGRLPTH